MKDGLFGNRTLITDIIVVVGVLLSSVGIFHAQTEQAKRDGALIEKVNGLDQRLARIERHFDGPTALITLSAGGTSLLAK